MGTGTNRVDRSLNHKVSLFVIFITEDNVQLILIIMEMLIHTAWTRAIVLAALKENSVTSARIEHRPSVGNVPEDCHAKIRTAVDYWLSIHPESGLPGRQHFDPADLRDFLENIWIADTHWEPLRFRYRITGTQIVRYLGLEPTGEWFDELFPHFADTHTYRDLTIAAVDAEPHWRRGVPTVRKHLCFKTLEQVSLPLATDGQAVDMVLNLTLFLNKEDKSGDGGFSANETQDHRS